MATYKEIKGDLVERVTTDPANPGEGDIWYNTTTGVLKGTSPVAATFSAGGNINTSRSQLAGAGTQTAGLIFGGSATNTTAPSVTNGDKTESYDGSAWTAVATKNNATRQQSGFGTQTAAVSFGGYRDPAGYFNGTEEWNGSAWSNGNTYPSSISNGSGASTGILTAAITSGGYNGTANVNTTSDYDGTSWTASGNYPITAGNLTHFGTQTAAVGVGGNVPPFSAVTAEYNGSTWTAVNNLPVPAAQNGRCGTQTNGMIYGGGLPSNYSTNSYLYDGTNWSSNPASLSTGRNGGGPATSQGSLGDAFLAGGDLSETTTYVNTEEYNSQYVGTKTLTTS